LTLIFSELEIESSIVHSFHLLNALLAELYEIFNNYVPLCIFCTVSVLPRYSTTLRILPEFVNVLVCHPGTFFPELDSRFRGTLLALATEFPILCCVLLAQPKEPRTS
jgi:hypothetical protein